MRPRLPTAIWIALAVSFLGWGPGCYYEVEELPLPTDQSVPAPPDLTDPDGGYDGPRCPNGAPPTHAGELAEATPEAQNGRWGAEPIAPFVAPSATAAVTLDSSRVAAGASSLRLDTTNAQAGVFYPQSRDAHFDLSPYLYLSFAVDADNAAPANDPGWKGAQPRLLLVTTKDDYYELVPDVNKLPRSPGGWTRVTVPLAGGYGWQRNTQGVPDLTNVRYFGLVFSTWGAGFTVWLDDVQIGPAPFYDCAP